MAYAKTIIHLSVGESDGYFTEPPLRWIIVKYNCKHICQAVSREGGFSLIWAIEVCAALEDMAFLPAKVGNGVSILVVLVWNKVWPSLQSCHELGMISLEEAAIFSSISIIKLINKSPTIFDKSLGTPCHFCNICLCYLSLRPLHRRTGTFGLGGAVTFLPEKVAKWWGLKLGCKRRRSPFSHLMKLLPLEK